MHMFHFRPLYDYEMILFGIVTDHEFIGQIIKKRPIAKGVELSCYFLFLVAMS